MYKIIALLNHKRGVSKTATTFDLGWMLAQKGKRVVMVDADPQCNLSGRILGEALDEFYANHPARNIHAALAPAYLAQPREIDSVECVEIADRPGLFLLPGHANLSEYEVAMKRAEKLDGSTQALKNLPGAFSYLVKKIAEAYRADFVLIDMSHSFGSINKNILTSSDGFLILTSPERSSHTAVGDLYLELPYWAEWARRAGASEALRSADYPFRELHMKFMGTITQKYMVRIDPTGVTFPRFIASIDEFVAETLYPKLESVELTLLDEVYYDAGVTRGSSFCLARIPDYDTLEAISQAKKTPVFALTDDMIGHVGDDLEQDRIKRDRFHEVFSVLADKVTYLAYYV